MKSFLTFNNPSKEKISFIKEIFDDISSNYDVINGMLSLFTYRLWYRRMIKELELSDSNSVIDFCTGTGELLIKLFKKFNLSYAVGIDISPGMLDIAKKKIEKVNNLRGRIEFQNVPAENTYITEKFDCATIAFALRNISNVPEVFNEMKRVIKKGGKISIMEFTTPSHKILKIIHRIYLKTIIPTCGHIFSGNKKAYKYLAESIINFPPPQVIVEMLEKEELSDIKVTRLALGAVTIFTCINN